MRYPAGAMLATNLDQLLTKFGFEKDKPVERPGRAPLVTYNAPHGLTASVYLARAEESLIIDRVQQIEVDHEVVSLVTHRKERYGAELDQVRVIRVVPETK